MNQKEGIEAEYISLQPLRAKTVNEFGDEPQVNDFPALLSYSIAHNKWQQAEQSRKEYTIVEDEVERLAMEIFDRNCYVETPLPYDEKVLVYYPNAIESMKEFASKSSHIFTESDMRKAIDLARTDIPFKRTSGNITTEHSRSRTYTEIIESLKPKVGQKVFIKIISETEAVIVK